MGDGMKYVVCGFGYLPDYRFSKNKLARRSIGTHECREMFIRHMYYILKHKKKFDHNVYLVATKNMVYSANIDDINLENDKTKLAVLSLPIAYLKSATDIDVDYVISGAGIAIKMPAEFYFRHWAIISIITGLLRLAYRLSHPLNDAYFRKVFKFVLLRDVEEAVKNNNKDVLRFIFKHVLKKFDEHGIKQDFLEDDDVREFVLKTLEEGSLLKEIKKSDWKEISHTFGPGIRLFLERYYDNNS